MSGCSASQDCPRCEGKDTLMTYSNYKPHPIESGECVRCGFFYYPVSEIMSKEDLDEIRQTFDYTDKVKFTKNELKSIEEFDDIYGVKNAKK